MDTQTIKAETPNESDSSTPEAVTSQPDTDSAPDMAASEANQDSVKPKFPPRYIDPKSESTKDRPRKRRTFRQWLRHRYIIFEAKISKLSTRNHFWHKILSWRYLPMAFRSGIRFEKGNVGTFSAVLPFRRFNRNWYNAMAGAALLGNAEIAGGRYVFEHCGADYTVVCKELSYKFMRPCVGPASYRCTPSEDIAELIAHGGEFNITVDMEIVQMVTTKDQRERRVGKATAKFHVTPKWMWRQRKERRRLQQRDGG